MHSLKHAENEVIQVPVDHVHPDEAQARKNFDPAQIEELAASVRQVGILEPIEVRTDSARRGYYVIVYGERRWRAARVAGLNTIPAFVDREMGGVRRRQLYENVMRVDLNVVELAANVAAVMIEEGLDTTAIAEQLRWPVRKVQRLVEIHEAPEELKRAIVTGIELDDGRRALSLSHALDVLRAYRHYARQDDTASKETALARLNRLTRTVIAEEWSGRKLQDYVGALGRSPKRDPLDRVAKNAIPKKGAGKDEFDASPPDEAAVSDGAPLREKAGTHFPLFEAKPDRFTVFLKRARESRDGAARTALSEALLALAREFTA